MSARLNELRHQRALAQEQLAWLDREIARETGGMETPPAVSLGVAPGLSVRRTATAPAATSPALSADEIMAQYQNSQGLTMQSEVKRGCLIYFFAAFALLGLGLVAVWFFRYR
jgi:hypothetical protein